ncbi:MAG: UMP kinase [Candidatus Taylorbacteria bacterium]|nr:UMP kinase [Candidatus Taylorbacteria bacterium]
MASNQKIVISLGGSLIVPDVVDVNFVSCLKVFLESKIKEGKEFILVAGGGRTARRYQSAGKEIANLSSDELDWVGIYSLRLNAEFIRIIFGSLAHPEVVTDPKDISKTTKPLVVGGAQAPGHSTDYVAVLFAKEVGAKQVINLSNIDFVYDKDPKNNPDAKKIEKISWSDFRKIIPEKWEPGLNAPFDPIAAKLAQELGLEVALMNGKPIDNLKNYIEGTPFKGTVIKG